MTPISYERHRLLPEVIRHAVWAYFRFALSLRAAALRLLRKLLPRAPT